MSTMTAIGMLPESKPAPKHTEPFVARSSHWIRASESGLLRSRASLGARVEESQKLGTIADPLGATEVTVRAAKAGIVIGRTELPLVNEGDALFHVATFHRPDEVSASLEGFQEELG